MAIENTIAEKRQLHELVESLSPDHVPAALKYMQYLSADAVLLSLLSAPADDEPYTDEQRRQDAEAEAAIVRGEGISQEDILREFNR